MIEYKEQKQISKQELISLYRSVHWSEYTSNVERLQIALLNSLNVITAWSDNRLVGLIRTVGDAQTILYIQDILVRPEYQNQGIGSELMQRILTKYKDVRQKMLLTDNTVKTRVFYEKQGFTATDHLGVVGFYREY
ncbi:GNAT family N-acetyltransferase [Lactobacillus sp. ESL0791]|uniref:GNAT family N-acetyltransferase n=1 Tax=Lactobacillus sp. ESL0791 TaxID=2983234 RepID=UPI0023F8316D|nr:GNAT family N-acetyltransferase [Lactobacillus sp. ESL0791]MDF7639039.1 GNAT family N-acetyltransferase [Lactobacillus sp. ESL0791]